MYKDLQESLLFKIADQITEDKNQYKLGELILHAIMSIFNSEDEKPLAIKIPEEVGLVAEFTPTIVTDHIVAMFYPYPSTHKGFNIDGLVLVDCKPIPGYVVLLVIDNSIYEMRNAFNEYNTLLLLAQRNKEFALNILLENSLPIDLKDGFTKLDKPIEWNTMSIGKSNDVEEAFKILGMDKQPIIDLTDSKVN